jgi:AcrR family transcriptional regulator
VTVRPAATGAPRERADAARNRRRVLDAARRLIAERGSANVSIDQVAEVAGVGKGTVFRRFGDRSGLFLALLDEQERELQDAFVRGPPPLGPGSPPDRRLIAFMEAYLAMLDRNLELLVMAEAGRPGTRYLSGAYSAWHQHLTLLLAAARPDSDAPALAHLLLAMLAGDLHRFLRSDGAIHTTRAHAAVLDLARRLVSR